MTAALGCCIAHRPTLMTTCLLPVANLQRRGHRSSAELVVHNQWIAGGKMLDNSEILLQRPVFVVVLAPYFCALKTACQSPSSPLCFVFIRHLNTRYSRF